MDENSWQENTVQRHLTFIQGRIAHLAPIGCTHPLCFTYARWWEEVLQVKSLAILQRATCKKNYIITARSIQRSLCGIGRPKGVIPPQCRQGLHSIAFCFWAPVEAVLAFLVLRALPNPQPMNFERPTQSISRQFPHVAGPGKLETEHEDSRGLPLAKET